MAQNKETRAVLTHRRASECVSRQIHSSEVSTPPQIINHLAHRFGVSVEVAALVAQLAGLGPREARHG